MLGSISFNYERQNPRLIIKNKVRHQPSLHIAFRDAPAVQRKLLKISETDIISFCFDAQ